MKKLEDIPKKNIFEVPDGYFDKLPGMVQARVAKRSAMPAWNLSWGWSFRYALPVLMLMAVGIFWFRSGSMVNTDYESEMARIQTDQLAVFLDDHDLTTDDLVESMTWSTSDLNELEKSVYDTYHVSHQEIEKVLDEYNVEL
jgi:hypothetical protein